MDDIRVTWEEKYSAWRRQHDAPVDFRSGFEESLVLPGDHRWRAAHAKLLDLHVLKSSTYGNALDHFRNFTKTAEILDKPDEYVAVCRAIEKLIRVVNMVEAGRADEVKEYPDVASLMLCAEAMLQRRLGSCESK